MPKTQTKCPDWHPHYTYMWTLAQLQAWYDQMGEIWSFYGGRKWILVAKRVCPNRYSVKFILDKEYKLFEPTKINKEK